MKHVDVSVIIATRNRAKELRMTLKSLARSLRHAKYEIIVVANGCTDDTEAMLNDLANQLDIVPQHLDRAGKSAALNRGMKIARGKLLAFTDDDVLISEKWFTELWRAFRTQRNAPGFCGPITPIFPEVTPLWLRRHPFRVPAFAEFAPPLREPQPCLQLPFGPNFSVRADSSRGLLFRTDLGASDINGPISCDDTEFAFRFRERAGAFWFIPNAIVGHKVRTEQLTTAWLFERAFLLGRSLIAQQVPNGPCYAPVWYVSWHPAYWNRFDCSLIVNFLVGQLYQCKLLTTNGARVASDICTLLPKLLPNGCKVELSASARRFLMSDECRQIRGILDNRDSIFEPGLDTGV